MNGIPFNVTIYGSDDNRNLRVSDCAVKDEMGQPKFAKRRGQLYPVHSVPKGIGSLEKVRGKNEWRSYCFMDTAAVAAMVAVLGLKVPLYISLDSTRKFKIYDEEIPYSLLWNQRVSRCVSALGAEYTLCMKRAFVLSLLLQRNESLDYIIGINRTDHNDGHTWVESNGAAVGEGDDIGKYTIIKKISVVEP